MSQPERKRLLVGRFRQEAYERRTGQRHAFCRRDDLVDEPWTVTRRRRRFMRLIRPSTDGLRFHVDALCSTVTMATTGPKSPEPRSNQRQRQRGLCRWHHGDQAVGIRATIRMDVVSSSSWSHGRSQKMALYEPGRPGISLTVTLASDSGYLAFKA